MGDAGYIRVSTEGQVEAYGKDVQIDGITRWAALNGRTISEWFEEDAVSGTTDGGDRPVLRSILARADEFDGIVFFDPTRIARRSVVQETLLALVWASGLRVFTTTTGEMDADEEDPTKILIRQILAVIAEFDHRSIVRRLRNARVIKSQRGGYIGGTPRYGMRVEGTGRNAQFVTDEVELNVIQSISQWNPEMSLRQIAQRLNAHGIPTKRGKQWTPVQVSRILERI